MALFDKLPDRFFGILSSSKKELYVEALFVLRQAFLSEMEIRRDDFASMLMNYLESEMLTAEFPEEEDDSPADMEDLTSLSGKAYYLIRRLRDAGWLEVEFDSSTFEDYITVPDYSVTMMDVLYSLSQEKVQEYNSYVYATFAALENAGENPEFRFQALLAAYQNTENLIRELKSLYNNIRRYQQRALNQMSANVLLAEHFDDYREQVVNAIYYPLKTIDSVPRFKHRLLKILNEWVLKEDTLEEIVRQGVERHVFVDEEAGREDALGMINYIADSYENVEETIAKIDQRHTSYTRASTERIRYIINSDQSARGKLVDLLQNVSRDDRLQGQMEEAVHAYRHEFADHGSLYARVKRTKRTEGKPLAIKERPKNEGLVESFLEDVRKRYTNPKIDRYMLGLFGDRDSFMTAEIEMENDEEFILFLLGTIRGREKSAPFSVRFQEGNVDCGGYSLPQAVFRKKKSPSKSTM